MTKTRTPTIPLGTKVRFNFGPTPRIGVIIEDRGQIGVGRRNLYGIEFPNGDETYYIELPLVEFEILTENDSNVAIAA